MTVAAFPEKGHQHRPLFQEKKYGMLAPLPWLAEIIVEEGADEGWGVTVGEVRKWKLHRSMFIWDQSDVPVATDSDEADKGEVKNRPAEKLLKVKHSWDNLKTNSERKRQLAPQPLEKNQNNVTGRWIE